MIMKNIKIGSDELINEFGEYLDQYGVFRLGLTVDEIKHYLKFRNGGKLKQTYKKFCKIAGCNTEALVNCPMCKENITLMYRWDVERFSNQLFDGTKTYFD